MKLNSLSIRTNMIFARNDSEIIERESYIVVKSMNNPTFHWGNYLIFKKAPVDGDIINWINIFQREFSHYKEFVHYLFLWDEPAEPKSNEYLAEGFELQKSISLSAKILNPPKHPNPEVIVRLLTSEQDWKDCAELQVLTRDSHFSYESYMEFKLAQDLAYKKLIKENRGGRFGAFLNGTLVADLGIYFESGLARYQSVVTHPDYRSRGVCGTLVYESGKYALENWPVNTLTMEADPDYHAARIYESVGFLPVENSYALYWYKFKP